MIFVKLMGGLGNQMFQYALGKHLALLQGTELVLDRDDYVTAPNWGYQLDKFQLRAQFSTQEMLGTIPRDIISRGIRYIFRTNPATSTGVNVMWEKSYRFDPKVLRPRDNVYLIGYWQSYLYFDAIQDIISNEFQFMDIPDEENLRLMDMISNTNSVSIHVRRGDYVSSKDANKVHGICSTDYYDMCIDYIGKRVSDPTFFIFSDDPEWARKNLNIPFSKVYVSHNTGDSSYIDMQLMSNCKFNVIANSTFSWWGAWLNRYSDKLVIAPRQWFAPGTKFDTTYLIPPTWIRL